MPLADIIGDINVSPTSADAAATASPGTGWVGGGWDRGSGVFCTAAVFPDFFPAETGVCAGLLPGFLPGQPGGGVIAGAWRGGGTWGTFRQSASETPSRVPGQRGDFWPTK